ncbi:cytochrome P450 [Microbispora triticiradicis]|uniref:Cytochrome P450 n=2 Tax=Microbispora TaxID=2005 RepID=A0ABY3LZ82_9ACTN|nr:MULTISPECIES: cytochrome P450 [Microbispora]TLP63948.1 cytochrome P450 [Microbispora fusca]TYB60789.1 cytochrome P450 [Microbispora tritici]
MTNSPPLHDPTDPSAASPASQHAERRREPLEGYADHADAVRLHASLIGDDPTALFQEMRREHGPVVPVLLDGMPVWYVIGYRELHHVTSQPRLFSRDPRRWNLQDLLPPDWPARPYVTWQPSVMYTEGAEHQRRVGAISDALDTVDRTELALICEQIADRAIDEFSGDGQTDLISRYADRIPAQVITRLFGLAETDLPELVEDVNHVLGGGEEALPAVTRILGKLSRLIADKRALPGHDLTSHMLAHHARVTDEEIVQDLIMTMISSHDNCSNWIGSTLRLMLMDDHFSMSLQGGRSSVGEALNDVLWKDPPTPNMPNRWAVQDCELAGRRIRRGDMLVLGVAAANADPQVQPAAHAGSGANRAHLAFGHGEYGCPFPAPELGGIIAKTAVEVLLDRLPDVYLAVKPDALRWRPSLWVRSLEALPVRFSPAVPTGQGLSNTWNASR